MNRNATTHRTAAIYRRRRTWLIILLVFLLVCSGLTWRLHQLRERTLLSRPLILAVKARNIAQAKSLLNRGADPNARDTPEIPIGLLEFLKDLLTTKNRTERETYPTALLLAVIIDENSYNEQDAPNSREMTKVLLEQGADINARNADGLTALMQACQYRYYDQKNTAASLLIARGANVTLTDKSGNTALKYALNADREELYEPLVAHGADPNTRDDNGSTALLYATGHGNLSLVKTLLEHKADPNLSNSHDPNSYYEAWENPLFHTFHFVLQERYYGEPVSDPEKIGLDILRLLLKHGANPNTTDEDETPLLLYAVEEGKSDIVRLLLEAGADPRRAGEDDQNALMIAAIQRNPEIVRLLLDWNRKAKTPLDINARDKAGQTALMIAAFNSDADIVRLLLANGANRTLRDQEGRTALRYAEDCPAALALLRQ